MSKTNSAADLSVDTFAFATSAEAFNFSHDMTTIGAAVSYCRIGRADKPFGVAMVRDNEDRAAVARALARVLASDASRAAVPS